MAILKQSTNYKRTFLMVQAADHISGLVGAAVTVQLSKAGAPFGAAAGAITEIGLGFYYILLQAADVGIIGDLAFECTAAAGDPTRFVDQVQATIFPDLNLDVLGNVSIASSIKRNQALNGFQFIMTDSTTHAPKTGLTVAAQRSLGGAGFAPCVNPVVEMSNGVYVINFAASDTNANCIMYRFTAIGADDLDILIMTQP